MICLDEVIIPAQLATHIGFVDLRKKMDLRLNLTRKLVLEVRNVQTILSRSLIS